MYFSLFPGQFWNIPVTVEEYTGNFNGVARPDDYYITIYHPDSAPRSFVGLKTNVTWEFESKTCYYVGNQQAGRLAEVPGGPIVEGTYEDYRVTSLFATSYLYSRFIEANCGP